MPRHSAILSLALVLSVAPYCHADGQAVDKSTEAEIRQAVAALQDCFNRGDAKGLAACWAPDGEFVGPAGQRIVGNEQIEDAFGEYLAAHKDSKLQLGIASWRLVADDAALVDLMTELTPVPEGLHSEPASTMVLVQRDGHWKIGSMYEMRSNVPSHRLQLKRLQWLVGNWMEDNGDPSNVSPRSTCDWNSTGQYLIRKFLVEGEEGETLSGTEIIGWDPRAHRIRSWSFDPDGSFGESTWTRDGEQWVINHHGTPTNGSDLSVTYLITLLDADTLKVEVKDRMVNGEKQPALPEVTLKRLPMKSNPKLAPIELPRQVLP